MSSIKTTQIDGDVSVGRNVAIGGKARVAGSATIGHNLKVEGWLEAANIKGTNKGVFLTVQKLREAYPNPHDGWFAGVGSSTPFTAYIGSGGDWVATGGTIEINVDMTAYDEEVEQLHDDISGMSSDIESLQSDVEDINEKLGAANGIATLDSSGKVQSGQIPSDVAKLDANGKLLSSEIPSNVPTLTDGKLSKSVLPDVVNDLTTGGEDSPLSAEMGKVIGQELTTPITEEITATSSQTGVISRGAQSFPSTQRGDIYSGASGHSVKLYAVTAGDTIKVKFTSNDGSGLAMAWYKTDDTSLVSSSTYYYTADTYKTETASASNEYDLVVPTDVELFGVSVKDTASVVITHVVNESRLTIAEEHITELQEDTEGISTEPLERVNLFNSATLQLNDGNPVGVSGKLDDYIIDNTGGVLPFSPDSHNNYSGVAAFPAETSRENVEEGDDNERYYVIYNPYSPVKYQGGIHVSPIVNGQFRKNNGTECVFYGEHITIVKGVWTASPTSQIQGLVFSLYYRPKTSQTRPTDFSNVEVYEVHSLPAAIEFVHSRWGETHKLKGINLEQQMLKVGGTLGSVFGQQSCVVFGDSLSADHTWSDNLAALLRLREMTNLAIGGANIHGAYNRTQKQIEDPTYHLLNPENVDLIYQILSSPTKMYDLCAKLGESRSVTNQQGNEVTAKVYTLDNVVILLGSNNTGSVTNNPMGDWESVKAADWTTLLPADWDWSVLNNNTDNFDSLYAAMRYCLMLIKSRVITAEVGGVTYGVDMTNARVMWVTPPQRVNVDVVTDTQTHEDVYCLESPEVPVSNMTRIERIKRIERIIMDVCEDLSIPVLCGRTQVNVSASEEATHVEPITINGESRLKFLGKNLRDGVHMTAEGYKQLTKAMVRAFIGCDTPVNGNRRTVVTPLITADWVINDNGDPFTAEELAEWLDEYLDGWENEPAALALYNDIVSDARTISNVTTSKAFFNALNFVGVELDSEGKDNIYADNDVANGITLSPNNYVDFGVVGSEGVEIKLPASYSRTDEFICTFACGNDQVTLTLPSGVGYGSGLDFDNDKKSGRRFKFSIQDGIALYTYID